MQQALSKHGLAAVVVEMPSSTRTAKDAAAAIGCGVGQIAKSLVFRGTASGAGVLVIVSGTNRVQEAALAGLVGEPVERATPEFVREVTGYAIGGVPPLGHTGRLPVWLDRDLFKYDEVWAAAGTPFAVFAIAPPDLQRVTGAVVVDIR